MSSSTFVDTMIIYDILEVQWCVQTLLQTAVTSFADFYSVPSQNVLTLEYTGRIQTGLAISQPMSRVPFIVGSWKGAWARGSKLEMLEVCGMRPQKQDETRLSDVKDCPCKGQ